MSRSYGDLGCMVEGNPGLIRVGKSGQSGFFFRIRNEINHIESRPSTYVTWPEAILIRIPNFGGLRPANPLNLEGVRGEAFAP